MNRAHFMAQLRDGLSGLHHTDIGDITADYERHFADGAADGRSEDEVAAALGDPPRLARELRAEVDEALGAEPQRLATSWGVVLALLGLVGAQPLDHHEAVDPRHQQIDQDHGR